MSAKWQSRRRLLHLLSFSLSFDPHRMAGSPVEQAITRFGLSRSHRRLCVAVGENVILMATPVYYPY